MFVDIILGLGIMYLMYRTSVILRRIESNSRDINHLYASRDSLWREFKNETSARKRQVTLLRRRIHKLREGSKNYKQDVYKKLTEIKDILNG